MSGPVLITGRGGMGDAIYARPFVRWVREIGSFAGDVQVSTSWPAVFSDLGVQCIKRMGGLATQAFHGEQVPAEVWAEPRQPAAEISLRYRWPMLARGVSVLTEMEIASRIRPDPLALDLPPLPASPVAGPYAIVRPPAIRVDYPAPSREPLPEYLATAAHALMWRMKVVTVGAWVPGLEEPNGPPIHANLRFENAELSIPELLALVAGASVVVSGPCWLIPACLATGTPLVVIAGGCGGRNNPTSLVDPRLPTAERVRWLLPDGYCRCSYRHHACPKVIPDFADRLHVELGLCEAVAA